MPEYIEREAAIKDVMAAKWKDGADGAMAMQIVATVPAADVAPVIRCKECAHLLRDNSASTCHLCMRRQHFPQEVNLDDFCSFGERWNIDAAD